VVALDECRDEDEPPDAGKAQQARHRLSVLLRLAGDALACSLYGDHAASAGSARGRSALEHFSCGH
jgi:hypothetical protein